jgi:hypothetical protein
MYFECGKTLFNVLLWHGSLLTTVIAIANYYVVVSADAEHKVMCRVAQNHMTYRRDPTTPNTQRSDADYVIERAFISNTGLYVMLCNP